MSDPMGHNNSQAVVGEPVVAAVAGADTTSLANQSKTLPYASHCYPAGPQQCRRQESARTSQAGQPEAAAIGDRKSVGVGESVVAQCVMRAWARMKKKKDI